MLIISYATQNKLYTDYSQQLIRNFNKVGHSDYHIEYYPAVNTKAEGCLIKPKFILDQLEKYKKPVLCIDVDSILDEKPKELDCSNYDIGLVFTPDRKNMISNGIHFWSTSDNSIDFLNRWRILCESKTLTSLDHHRLIQTYKEFKDKINIIDIRKDIRWCRVRLNYNNTIMVF